MQFYQKGADEDLHGTIIILLGNQLVSSSSRAMRVGVNEKICISMFLVAAAWTLVALVALLRVVVVVGMSVLAFLFLLGLISLGDWFGKGFLALELFFLDDVDGRNRTNLLLLRPRFLLFGNSRYYLKLSLINLMIVDPVSSILHHSILRQLSKSMSEVILKIADINKPIFVVDLSITAFLIISVLSTILYASFMFFEVPLSMSQSI